MKIKRIALLMVGIVLCFNFTAFAAEYEITDLGDWEPKDINNNGQIVGTSASLPVLWENGVLIYLSDLVGSANGINDSGQVVGTIDARAYVWQNGQIKYLSTTESAATDINDLGYIAGNNTIDSAYPAGVWLNNQFEIVADKTTSYYWGSSMYDPSFTAINTYFSNKINNQNNILGTRVYQRIYSSNTGFTLNYSWVSQGALAPLPTGTTVNDINDSNQIVGDGFITKDDQCLSLNFNGMCINSLGEAVGSMSIDDDNIVASLYRENELINLNDLILAGSGWDLDQGKIINDLGQIVCSGTLNGVNKVCLLTPIYFYELSDKGTEFPVNYENYGTFSDQGTGIYNYEITNPVGLSAAVGEGIYPNSESVLLDPRYQEYLSSGKLDGDVWSFVNSDDPWADYFKWATAINVQLGEKLFYTAIALENCGQYQQAIKAYKALIVHFPYTQAYNPYENIYWYPGIAAIDAINRLCVEYPELGYELINAKITIENGYDSDPDDDIFTVSTGAFAE